MSSRHSARPMETVIETAPAAPSIRNSRLSVVAARALRDPCGLGGVDAGHHDDEFLAAQPTEQIAAADDAAQPIGEALEHEIADVVAIGVVDALEMVDVENHQRQRRAAHARVLDHRREMALEEAAIVEAGQRVEQRQLDRLLHVLAQRSA